jgi:hypothetical protein
VRAAAELAAARLIMADFEAAAVQAGSVISVSLCGGLAASGALPFPRAPPARHLPGGPSASCRKYSGVPGKGPGGWPPGA